MTIIHRVFCRVQFAPLYIHTVLHIAVAIDRTFWFCKQIFRYDTYGDEEFWSGLLHIDKAIAGANNGGFGTGVSPNTALAVGLKVDSDALPQSLISQLKHGRVNLDDPATTLALLKLNAVVGVKGTFKADGSLQSVGITCALCHSTVDNSFAPGIGQRLE